MYPQTSDCELTQTNSRRLVRWRLLRQSRSIEPVGTCTVPQQVLAAAVRHRQTIKKTDAKRRRVDVG